MLRAFSKASNYCHGLLEKTHFICRVGKYLPNKKSDFLPDGKIFTKTRLEDIHQN